jgi:hypothetical protein
MELPAPPADPAPLQPLPRTARQQLASRIFDVAIAGGVFALAWLGATASGGAATAKHLPDLRTLRPAAAPAMVTTGVRTTWHVTVGNVGGRAARASTLRVLLSADTKRSASDLRVGSAKVAGIGPGRSRRITATFTVPIGTRVGTWHLLGCIVPRSGERQLSAKNDCVAAGGTTMVMAPDVAPNPGDPTPTPTPTNPTPPPQPTLTAATLTTIDEGPSGFSTTPTVNGTGATAGSTVRLYRSGTCAGSPIGTASAAADGTFNVKGNGTRTSGEVSWGATSSLAVSYAESSTSYSFCSNALSYTHTGITITPVPNTTYTVPSPGTWVHGTPIRFVSANSHPPIFSSPSAFAAPLSGNLAGEYRIMNPTAGTYTFMCQVHNAMTGTFTIF